jgi:recombination protein RecT
MEQMRIKTPTNTAAMAETAKAKQKAEVAATGKKQLTVVDYLNSPSFSAQIAKALPKFFDLDRFTRSAISEFRLNPALQQCSVPSVLGYFMQAAMCGLEPATTLGQCYAVPFKNGKTGEMEAQFILGYRGMMSIARRSGDLARIEAHIVHEKDEFSLSYGLNPDIEHKPFIDGDPGEVRGAYCVVWFKDGNCQYRFMPKSEIDKHRSRSKAGRFGPWVTDYEEMCLKTVFRSMFKWLPISLEAAQAVKNDDAVVTYKNSEAAQTADDLIEVSFVAATPDEAAEGETSNEQPTA